MLIKGIIFKLALSVQHKHLYSHHYDCAAFDQLPRMKQLDAGAETIAKDALTQSVAKQRFIT